MMSIIKLATSAETEIGQNSKVVTGILRDIIDLAYLRGRGGCENRYVALCFEVELCNGDRKALWDIIRTNHDPKLQFLNLVKTLAPDLALDDGTLNGTPDITIDTALLINKCIGVNVVLDDDGNPARCEGRYSATTTTTLTPVIQHIVVPAWIRDLMAVARMEE